MIQRLGILSLRLASADTVSRLTGGKYQPTEVQPVLAEASALVEAVAGWSRAARLGTYKVAEPAPLGSIWTLPIYPVLSVQSLYLDGQQITDFQLQNACQIIYKAFDIERLHDVPPTAEATITAGYAEDEAPLPVLLAVAVATDMLLSQTAVGPRELSAPGLSIKLPPVVRAIQEALGVA